jgi:peptidoglycan/xylan/chitin deacetylase (PgdA/CDA1 family)
MGAFAAWAVRGRSSSVFAPSVFRGCQERRALALTFDDGPSESTPAVLDVLDSFGVRATFFQCGWHVRRLPDITRQVSAAGHEIGNHSDTHRLLCLQSPRAVYEDLARSQDSIAAASGRAPALFRPPYGVRWFGLGSAQAKLGLLGVMWTLLGRDWKLDVSRIASRLIRGVSNGAILCLHDGRELTPGPDIRSTVAALRIAIPELLTRGYRFETVSQLICPTNSPER